MTPTLKPLPDELPPHEAAALDRELDALREASAGLAPRASLEAELLKQWKKRSRPGLMGWVRGTHRPAGGFGQFGVPAAALALSLGFAGWMTFAPLMGPLMTQSPRMPGVTAPADSGDAPFIALQPMERIAQERDATVVSTTFPRALLANYGLPVSPERAGEPVRADMLLSGSGQPLALRIIE
jgi:hypothetical protein